MAALPGAKESDKIGETDLHGILLNSMTNGWIKKAYGKGFDCENITFKKSVKVLN